jgi:hypothetical protein
MYEEDTSLMLVVLGVLLAAIVIFACILLIPTTAPATRSQLNWYSAEPGRLTVTTSEGLEIPFASITSTVGIKTLSGELLLHDSGVKTWKFNNQEHLDALITVLRDLSLADLLYLADCQSQECNILAIIEIDHQTDTPVPIWPPEGQTINSVFWARGTHHSLGMLKDGTRIPLNPNSLEDPGQLVGEIILGNSSIQWWAEDNEDRLKQVIPVLIEQFVGHDVGGLTLLTNCDVEESTTCQMYAMLANRQIIWPPLNWPESTDK